MSARLLLETDARFAGILRRLPPLGQAREGEAAPPSSRTREEDRHRREGEEKAAPPLGQTMMREEERRRREGEEKAAPPLGQARAGEAAPPSRHTCKEDGHRRGGREGEEKAAPPKGHGQTRAGEATPPLGQTREGGAAPPLSQTCEEDRHRQTDREGDEEAAPPLASDAEYCLCAELLLLLTALHSQALSSLRISLVGGRGAGVVPATFDASGGQACICGPGQLAERVAELKALITAVRSHNAARLARADADAWTPRVERIASAYRLSSRERDALLLMLLLHGATSALWSESGLFEDVDEGVVDALLLRVVCSMSAIEAHHFMDEERLHVKEGLIHVHEDDLTPGKRTAALTLEAAEALTHGICVDAAAGGRATQAARSERLTLKLSGTQLLRVLQAEAASVVDEDVATGDAAPVDLDGGGGGDADESAVGRLLRSLDGGAGVTDTEGPRAERTQAKGGADASVAAGAAAAAAATELAVADAEALLAQLADETEADGEVDALDVRAGASVVAAATADMASASAAASASALASALASESECVDAPIRGYASELEYLDDQFMRLVHRIQLSSELAKQRVRHMDVEEERGWEPRRRRANTSELQAKVRLIEGKIALRLGRAGALGTPRLERLCAQLALDGFEKSVLLLACGNTISPVVKQLLASTGSGRGLDADELTVGRILQVLTSSFHEQVEKRVYFYRSGTLVKKGLVRLGAKAYARGADDLTDLRLTLDRRVLDCLVGLDNESDELEGASANLYTPSAELADVVLPEATRERLLTLLDASAALRVYSRRVNLSEAIPQPEGLVLLLCGPSGSGKTMTANAVAGMLGHKVLLVNFPLMRAERGNGSLSPQSLLREAELANAILFFDECESLFASRGAGGSAEMTELLTEIERFQGIVFLATNRPQDLDEAMYRRITAVFELPAPNHKQRRQIWAKLTAADAVPLSEEVDLDEVALRYELTGGYIRNAVLSALMRAAGRCPASPRIVQADLHAGCREQMRGALQLHGTLDGSPSSRDGPQRSLDSLILPTQLAETLSTIRWLEKARPVLQSEWGFADTLTGRGGMSVLFWGPPGAGKRTAAEALAFELGRPVRSVHFASLLAPSGRVLTGGRDGREGPVHAMFREGRLADALILINGVDPRVDALERDERALQLLLHETERYPGIVVFCCAVAEALDAVVHMVHPALLRTMKQVVQFRLPDTHTRERLWRSLVPAACPLDEFDPTKLAAESDGFGVERMQACIWKAGGLALMAGGDECGGVEHKARGHAVLRQADLLRAVREEKEKVEGRQSRIISSMML